MKSAEIRERFLSFFESQGHMRHASSSLVPDDPTLLTTSAGMVQFKPYFLGLKKPPKTRLTTSQKCLRAVDIEEVGRTPRHHTFFEMLGNFSFGDYFKQEAITWAWKLLREGFEIPEDKLKVTVYHEDAEAARIWLEEVGVKKENLYYLGEKDNYWPASAPSLGPNGPCGPCSEIFFDFGLERGCGKPDCDVTCDCKRFIEIWNLVFMQFERQDGGVLIPLPAKNIDTGSGLERVASVLQGTQTNFETDLLFPIIQKIASESGVEYDANPVPMRVIADHVRGSAFLISDGVFPSNEGRGYLLRKILRRAATSARELGIEKPFMSSLVPVVADIMGKYYPEFVEKIKLVTNVIEKEEIQFTEALQMGRMFVINKKDELEKSRDEAGLINGGIIFTAYDTYGLPLEEAEKIVREMGFKGVNKTEFDSAMNEQKERSRSGSKMDGSVFVEDATKIYRDAAEENGGGKFDGYEYVELECAVTAIIKGGEKVTAAAAGDEVSLILDKTPFYGEMGGQVGDEGRGEFDGGSVIVSATSAVDGSIMVHAAKVEKGALKVGSKIKMKVDKKRRQAIMRHHTATHLLHAALRKTLGEHVVQSGSYVGPDKLRFDFTHHESVSRETVAKIEKIVNEQILEARDVVTKETSFEEAKKSGAMALFGEKYGEKVRMVGIEDFSKELCGGTHVRNTAEIGLLKIVDERSIGSSMRRIEALCGEQALDYLNGKIEILKEASATANVQDTALVKYIESQREELAVMKKKMKSEGQGKLKDISGDILKAAEDVGGVSLIAYSVDGLDTDALRNVYDGFKSNLNSYAALLGSNQDGKASLILAFSDDVVARGLDAGKMIKDIAREAGGGGGGAKNMAQAGGKKGEKIADAISKGADLIKKALAG